MTPFSRLERLWVYGGFLSALIILALTPLVWQGWSSAFLAVWLMLPVYMVHQYEEHDDNRFARFMTEEVGKGRQVLSPSQIFWINIGGVWILNTICIWLATKDGIGWGLVPLWTAFLNAVLHIGQAIRMKKYNPGLVTAIVLFLPLTVWGSWTVNQTGQVTDLQYAAALVVAVGLHGSILLLAYRNLTRR